MGTKISALTETGSAPTGAYYPLEYDNANYKISTETLRGNLGGKYVADWATSHGGVTVANGATLIITHNLGTMDVVVFTYVNNSATDDPTAGTGSHGQGPQSVNSMTRTEPTQGCVTRGIDENSFELQLGIGGYVGVADTGAGNGEDFATMFIKVVVLSAGTGGTAQKVADSAAQSGSTTVDYKIGDLQGEDQVFISASIRHDHASFSGSGFQINATYGRSDASATKTLCASVNGRIAGQVNGEYSPYIAYEGGAAVEFSNFVAEFSLIAVGDEVFVRVDTTVGSAVAGTVYWSYTASAGAGGAGSGNSEISFRADRNGSGQSISYQTETQVAFTNEVFDLGGKFDTSTYRFTPGAGRYLLTATILLNTITAAIGHVYIRKNGVTIATCKEYTSDGGAGTGDYINLTVTIIAEANSTDYFDVWVYHDDGGTRTLSGTVSETWFAGCKI
tara:strand:+ start:728 stop:2071 length:1344 start_codon:yes stop_codon:yes gene_type:complete